MNRIYAAVLFAVAYAACFGSQANAAERRVKVVVKGGANVVKVVTR